MAYPQQQSMGQFGQQQQRPGFGGHWLDYISPAGSFAARNLGDQNKPIGQNLWDLLFGEQPSIEQIGGNQELGQYSQNQFMNPHEGFEPIRQNALRTFHNDIVPYIQGQFQSKGGGRNASHFSSGSLQKNTYGAGATLADRLASAQAQYGQNQQQNAISGYNASKPQYFQNQGGGGALEPLLNALMMYLKSQGGA